MAVAYKAEILRYKFIEKSQVPGACRYPKLKSVNRCATEILEGFLSALLAIVI